ncbi:phosphatase PAP2 family protein [Candidatus Gottesmanbacteria bacterium]|nr:phosphatase PAP2 family protein [Candidatus Gottesmanbacteria bacterium]
MEKSEKKVFLGISLLLGGLYTLISFIVATDAFRSIDLSSMQYLQVIFPRVVDVPFSYLSLFGSAEVMTILVGIIFIGILLWKRQFFSGIFLYVLIVVIELFGKLFIFHPPPPTLFNRYALGFHLPSSFIVQTNFSYPSGHMARVAFLSVIAFVLTRKFIRSKKHRLTINIIIFSFATLVFISRIYLGEHWLSDVLGGALLGGMLASISVVFW